MRDIDSVDFSESARILMHEVHELHVKPAPSQSHMFKTQELNFICSCEMFGLFFSFSSFRLSFMSKMPFPYLYVGYILAATIRVSKTTAVLCSTLRILRSFSSSGSWNTCATNDYTSYATSCTYDTRFKHRPSGPSPSKLVPIL